MGERIQTVIERIRSAGSALVNGVGQGGKTTIEAVRQGAGLQLGLLASVGSVVEAQLQSVGKIKDGSEFLQSQRKLGESLYDSTLSYFDGLREAGFGAQAGWKAAATTVAEGFGLKKHDN